MKLWIDSSESCSDFSKELSWLDIIEKQGIMNLRRYSSKIYSSWFLIDSEVTFLREKEDADFCLFLYCVLLLHSVA